MYRFGLLLMVCYVPGYLGAFIPTQWAVLSILLPLGLWRSGVFSPSTLAGLAVLAWSAISLLWAPNPFDAGYGLWIACIWGLAFWFGSTVSDFRPLWQGMAVGMAVSSAVAIIQSFGYKPFEAATPIAGLFFNSTLLGCCATLVIVALITQRQWKYIPGCLPALWLAQSRGAFLVLGLTLLTRWIRLRWIILALAISGLTFLFFSNITAGNSDAVRLTIWGMAMRNLTLLGNGIGSFSTYYIYNGNMLYPERAHNDYLQLWFELGIGATIMYFLYALCLRCRTSDHWPIFFAFSLMGLFYFPLWAPVPAFMACMVAGAMLRDRHLDRLAFAHGRYSSLPGTPRRQSLFPRLGRKPVPTA